MQTEHMEAGFPPSSLRWRPYLHGKHNTRLLIRSVITRHPNNRTGVVVLKQYAFFNPCTGTLCVYPAPNECLGFRQGKACVCQ